MGVPTAAGRERLSELHSGAGNPMHGRKHTPEALAKIRAARAGHRRRVLPADPRDYGLAERWRERIYTESRRDGKCWTWAGRIDENGYGRMTFGRAYEQLIHRLSFRLFVGVIPAGLQLDHVCRNRACVNPDHLEPVTASENVRRGVAARTAP